MGITTYTFDEYVQAWFNTYAQSANVTPNPVAGDPALALAEADASQAVVLQFMAVNVINFARATTSVGTDLDSWMADFAFTRLQSTYATGQVTMSTAVPATQIIYIPIGTVVQTAGGAITYTIVADNSLPTYNASQQAYYIPIGNSSCNVAVTASAPGASSNVQSAQITQLANTVFGIATLTNALAIQDGSNQETDAAFRARFVDYINSLSKATETAIYLAISNIQTGLKIGLFENVLAVGNPPTSFVDPDYGNIVALVDDGSGAPSVGLLNAVGTAVANTVAFGIQYQTLQPAILVPAIAFTLILVDNPSQSNAAIMSAAQVAIVNYVNALAIGGGTAARLYITKIIDIASSANVNIQAVQAASTTINGLQADLVLQRWQEIVISITNVVVVIA